MKKEKGFINKRSCGIFLHPVSLPGPSGIGDFGDSAYQWIDWLKQAGHTYWQVCPLGPTGYGDSPYQCFSSFAGNPLLISLERLRQDGLLKDQELNDSKAGLKEDRVKYGEVIKYKERLLRSAFFRFSPDPGFEEFCSEQSGWLDDYALFRILKVSHNYKEWPEWEERYKKRDPEALREFKERNIQEVMFHRFLQYSFFAQLGRLREYASKQGIKIIGDIPYYTAYDSCDVWADPDLFELDVQDRMPRVAGVPPDYFSSTGQLWGNPLFRWDRMKNNGYSWWKSRIRSALSMADVLRFDHFRAFESYWAVPASEETAMNGEWEKGPGQDFFNAVAEELGELPFIIEDLGEITDDVVKLAEWTGLPGMKVLQFAFDYNTENPHLPYNIPKRSVTYSGTHDNDTTVGWIKSLDEKTQDFIAFFTGSSRSDLLSGILRSVYSSPSVLSIIPFQDVCGLGSEARFNVPGKPQGNWQWRMTEDMLSSEKSGFIKRFAEVFGRSRQEG